MLAADFVGFPEKLSASGVRVPVRDLRGNVAASWSSFAASFEQRHSFRNVGSARPRPGPWEPKPSSPSARCLLSASCSRDLLRYLFSLPCVRTALALLFAANKIYKQKKNTRNTYTYGENRIERTFKLCTDK